MPLETADLFRGDLWQRADKTAIFLETINRGERLLADWPPLTIFANSLPYREVLQAVGEGCLIGSFPSAILSPNFLEVYGRDQSGEFLNPGRCSDCDIATWTSLEVIVSRLDNRSLTAKRVNSSETAWRSASGQELYRAPRLELSAGGLTVATIFNVAGPEEVTAWLQQRAFYDETVALRFGGQTGGAMDIVDSLNSLFSGNYWGRSINLKSNYQVEKTGIANFDVLTKLEKVFPRIIEKGAPFTNQTQKYINELLSNYLELKKAGKIFKNDIVDFEKRVAKAMARSFAVDPLRAYSLYFQQTSVAGLFSPTMARIVGEELAHQKIVQTLGYYGTREIGDREYSQFYLVLPHTFPASLTEVLKKILGVINPGAEDLAAINSEMGKNWPRGLKLGARWIPNDAPLTFDSAITIL